MVSDPYVDNVSKDAAIISQGEVDFLKIALEDGDGDPISPHANAFTRSGTPSDDDGVRVIKDPDGVDVTSSWVTNELDPDDNSDTFDENHPDYVGDQASPANTGLFHGGESTLSKRGKIAQKVKVPDTAEATVNDPSRAYTIEWKVQWGVDSGGDPLFATLTEQFNVREVVLVASQTAVTVADVKAAINTTLDDDEITAIINEATRSVHRKFRRCGIDPLTNENVVDDVADAVIFWSRGMITIKNPSASQPLNSVRQANKTKRFAQSATDRAMDWFKMAKNVIMEACEDEGDENQVSAEVQTRDFWYEALP